MWGEGGWAQVRGGRLARDDGEGGREEGAEIQ